MTRTISADPLRGRSLLSERLDDVSASLKSILPGPLRERLSRFRSFCIGIRSRSRDDGSDLRRVPPWCSPNIWEDICDAYSKTIRPVVFEYGCGASTLRHMRNLIPLGGTYIGVESDHDWYARVVAAVLAESLSIGDRLEIAGGGAAVSSASPKAYNTRFVVRGTAHPDCIIELRLRPATGSAESSVRAADPWSSYVEALAEPCDAVIIDGRARKACVRRALAGPYVKKGGLLALFEAGRGRRNWLGRPTLTGEDDYRAEVGEMLARGGRMVDGCGVDRWHDLESRRTPGREARHYPQEACFLFVTGT